MQTPRRLYGLLAAAAGTCNREPSYRLGQSQGPNSVGSILVRKGGEDTVVRGPSLRIPHQVVEDVRLWDVPATNEFIPAQLVAVERGLQCVPDSDSLTQGALLLRHDETWFIWTDDGYGKWLVLKSP